MAPMTLNTITGVLGTLGITALTAAGAAYLLFRYLGDKWLTAKFSERLEVFKHAQQQELEQLRLRINTTFDRTVKLHAQEFEVLPEVWGKLNEAYHQVHSLIHPFQEYPDLDRMGGPAFEHFLSESDLADYQKDELRETKEKTKKYMSLRFWQSFGRVGGIYNEFTKYFVAKGIFVPTSIKEPINELKEIMYDALIERQHNEQFDERGPERFKDGKRLRTEGKELRDKIEHLIHERMWAAGSLPQTIVSSTDLPAG